MGQFLKHLVQLIAVYSNCCSHGIDEYLMELQSFWISKVLTLVLFFIIIVIKKQLKEQCVSV